MKRRRLSLIAGLVTTVALLGGSLAPAHAAPRSAAPTPATYAALGDSFASGWGAGQPINALGQTREAHPVLLAGGSPTNLTFLAFAEGATTESVRQTQVAAIPVGAKQVTLTVGGNDLAFVPTVTVCLLQPDACEQAVASAVAKLGAVRQSLSLLIAEIHARAPQATIYVTGYPLLFQARGDVCVVGTSGGQALAVPAAATRLLDAATKELNRTIKSATTGKVSRYAKYVDVTEPFSGHGVCGVPSGGSSNPRAWVNPIVLPQPEPVVWLHPTAKGQQAYAYQIKDKGFRAAPRSRA
ncbi:MAG: SGNH/GDSL hydrolase family protein [Actinomycetes bacterium]